MYLHSVMFIIVWPCHGCIENMGTFWLNWRFSIINDLTFCSVHDSVKGGRIITHVKMQWELLISLHTALP